MNGYHDTMDYETRYERISAPFRDEGAARTLNLVDKWLVHFIALAYIVALIWLLSTGDARFWRALVVPAVTFAIVSGLRLFVNAPRPYEATRIDPVIHKETLGKSLPSRHVASAAIIACALFCLSPVVGAIAFLGCVAVCFTRIVGGVHFPRDVVAAVLIAAICGVVGFAIVP